MFPDVRKCCTGPLQELAESPRKPPSTRTVEDPLPVWKHHAGSRSKLQPQTPRHSREVAAQSSENGPGSPPSQREKEKNNLRNGGTGHESHSFGSPRETAKSAGRPVWLCFRFRFIWISARKTQRAVYLMGRHYRSFSTYKSGQQCNFLILFPHHRCRCYSGQRGSRV